MRRTHMDKSNIKKKKTSRELLKLPSRQVPLIQPNQVGWIPIIIICAVFFVATLQYIHNSMIEGLENEKKEVKAILEKAVIEKLARIYLNNRVEAKKMFMDYPTDKNSFKEPNDEEGF